MKKTWIATSSLIVLTVSQALSVEILPTHQINNPWYADAQIALLKN
jgi:hypothetical protein